MDVHTLRRMCSLMSHRGPDDEGIWVRSAGGSHRGPWVGLGHRRLSIIDLSLAGRQPMPNEDGSLRLVFNGEIYNFGELREQLIQRGHRFRSRTDSEVILHLYEEKGERALQDLRGMFALGIWDETKRALLLARDRLGQKPLYYRLDGDSLTFASEAKAFKADPRWKVSVNLDSLYHYLTLQYVPGDLSAWEGVKRLPPAHYLIWKEGTIRVERYWTLPWDTEKHWNPRSAVQELMARLEEAVRLRLVSDVQLGAFLSGGLDSSAVVALMRLHSRGPLRTLTVDFQDDGSEDVRFAREVAGRYRTDHEEIHVTPNIQEDLPRIAWHYDEPFGDPSAVPTFYVCRAMSQRVKAALCGDGGDEAFAGYQRYRALGWYRRFAALPRALRQRMIPSLLSRIPARGWERSHWLHRVRLFARPGEDSLARRYGQWISHFPPDEKEWLCSEEFLEEVSQRDTLFLLETMFQEGPSEDLVGQALHTDINTYLPDDLLVKMDIASMAHSLEVRSPFLDHYLLEFAASLPSNLKVRWGRGKWILRRSLRGLLPKGVLQRRKRGFTPPLERWLQEDLREMVWDLLTDQRARERGYFRPERVERLIREHMEGVRNRHYQIWNLLMLELWHRCHVEGGMSGFSYSL